MAEALEPGNPPSSKENSKKQEYFLPKNVPFTSRLRACLNCGLLKTFQEFFLEGCDNCESVMQFLRNPDRVIIFTSLKFEGIVGLTEENTSWNSNLVAVDNFRAGLYALHVFGTVPDGILEEVFGILSDDSSSSSIAHYCRCG